MTMISLTGLCRVNPAFTVCPVKCREVTVKKKRVETFRNIRYGDGRIYIYILYTIIQTAQQLITSAMLSIVGERERTHLGSIYAHARFLSGCSGMVECLAS